MPEPHATGDHAAARHSEARRVGRFVAVGCAAAAVHWAVVVVMVSQWGWQPLIANVLGWLLAFTVSFAGHQQLTFRDRQVPVWSSLGRFFVVSAGGFCVNELTYALLLGWSGQRYDLVLATVLLGVAIVTFLLSRHWVFLRSEGR